MYLHFKLSFEKVHVKIYIKKNHKRCKILFLRASYKTCENLRGKSDVSHRIAKIVILLNKNQITFGRQRVKVSH